MVIVALKPLEDDVSAGTQGEEEAEAYNALLVESLWEWTSLFPTATPVGGPSKCRLIKRKDNPADQDLLKDRLCKHFSEYDILYRVLIGLLTPDYAVVEAKIKLKDFDECMFVDFHANLIPNLSLQKSYSDEPTLAVHYLIYEALDMGYPDRLKDN